MSYARFSAGDVYVFHHVDGYLTCMACLLEARRSDGWRDDFKTTKRSEMIRHLTAHRRAGHDVPPYARGRLIQEKREQGDDLDK